MTPPPEDAAPDPELERLVSRFLDQTLTPEESQRLEQRIHSEPAAKLYCARAIRFDASLQEALDPQALEWEETRRVVFDPKKGAPAWSVQRHQTLRYGSPGIPGGSPGRQPAWRRWWPAAGLGVILAAAALAFLHIRREGSIYQLRNGDFEAMDLSRSPEGKGSSVLHWQDNFSTAGAEIQEISRVSSGRIFARSGHNVVRLTDRAFINQLILNGRNEPLKATPGLRVVLTGWSYTVDAPPHELRGSLRFVASSYPDMIQYEAANATILLPEGGWHPLRLELTVPENLLTPASDISTKVNYPPPPLDLAGKEMTLSLDDRSPGGSVYLDDLKIEVIPPRR